MKVENLHATFQDYFEPKSVNRNRCWFVYLLVVWFVVFRFLHRFVCICKDTDCFCFRNGLRWLLCIFFVFWHLFTFDVNKSSCIVQILYLFNVCAWSKQSAGGKCNIYHLLIVKQWITSLTLISLFITLCKSAVDQIALMCLIFVLWMRERRFKWPENLCRTYITILVNRSMEIMRLGCRRLMFMLS